MVHFTKFPDADFKDVVRPNADTYYNTASLDLSNDAMVLEVPNTNGRYYLLPILDAWTNVFISPGKRTTGTEAQKYLITGPQWKGTVPAGLEEIKAPTNLVWMIGRVQVNSAEDGKNVVVPLEKKITLTPLASYGKPYTAPKGTIDPTVSTLSPNEQLENMSIVDYFKYVNTLMVANPPAAAAAPRTRRHASRRSRA
jgi:DNA sulfur modification protein DndE